MTPSARRTLRRSGLVLWSFVAGAAAAVGAETEKAIEPLAVSAGLPPLPDEHGFAGMFAGTSGGVLVAAGGANFPEKPPWQRGRKVWYDTIYVLEKPKGPWKIAKARLPRPLAYGVSITWDDALLCLGGGDGERHYADCFMLRWTGSRVERTDLPDLPAPRAQMCGAVLGSTIYLAGGTEGPNATAAKRSFWALDMSLPEGRRRWRSLRPWPGPERFQAVAGAHDGSFFLFSGIRLEADSEGKPRRVFPLLADAYRYRPGKTPAGGRWTRLADMPHPTAAAPSPAISLGQSHLLILGGSDGLPRDVEPADHPGFPRRVLAYLSAIDAWTPAGTLPEGASRVTAPLVRWNDGWAVVSGEVRPGVRSPEVLVVRRRTEPRSFGPADWSALTVYLAALVAMGAYFSQREKTTDDFFLGGRRIPWWAAGLSIFGTQLSAITFMAIPAVAYATDWVRMIAQWTIPVVAAVVVAFYLPFFRRLDVSTAYEYLERRFNLAVRLFGSVAFMAFQLGRMGVVLCLPALALTAVTGMNVYLCIALMGLLSTVYTVMGGIEAVVWTDVLQVVVLVAGAVICLVVVVADVGGPGRMMAIAADGGRTHIFDWGWAPSRMVVWVMVVGNLFWNLIPYTADQTVVQRYLTTPDEKQAANSVWLNAVLSVPVSFLFFLLGAALYAFYKTHPELVPAGRTDEILPWFIVRHLHPGVAGIVVAGIFAAAMSSLDSSMNSVATAYVNDFHRRLKKGATDRACLAIARRLTVLVGVFGTATAFLIASLDVKSLFDHFILLAGLLGSGLAGVFMLGIFTRRAHAVGAIFGAVVGTAVPLAVKYLTDVNFFLYAAIGIASCFTAGYLASLVLPGGKRDLAGLTIYSVATAGAAAAPSSQAD